MKDFVASSSLKPQFTINKETCIQCGLCASDCPFGVISLESDYPVLTDEVKCRRCQHCFTLCPTGSVSVIGLNPDDSTLLKGNFPEKNQMATLIKGRRSTRQFKDEELSSESIDELLNIVWHAPSAHNSQQVLMNVVYKKAAVGDLRDYLYSKLKAASKDPAIKDLPGMDVLAWAQKVWEDTGLDVIFRNAPHLIITSAPENGSEPMQDTMITLSYFDLMAPSMGLGTLWNGLFMWSIKLFPEIKTHLGVPDDHMIGYAMLFGKPSVEYQRTAQQGVARVNKMTNWGKK